MNARPRLLTVDDDAGARRFVRSVATGLGFDVVELGRSEEFSRTVGEANPAVIVLDLNMPGTDGVTLLRQLQALRSTARLIFMSQCDTRTLQTVSELARAYGLSAAGFVQKPAAADQLERLLRGSSASAPVIDCDEVLDALARGDIVPWYQPRIHRQDGRWTIRSVEALARWTHPRLGLVTAASFIPQAEQCGLIARITEIILDRTVDQLRQWATDGLDLQAAVNISPLLVDDLSLPDRIRRSLEKHGVEPARLGIEVTESAAISDSQNAMEVLARLRVLGIGLAIDDFGTGSSSLLQLFRMPFNELKIDRRFVKDIPDLDDARRIVEATVNLAHSLNIRACAEGVESDQVLAFLQEIGCDMVQGYIVSKAVPARDLGALLRRWNGEPERRNGVSAR